MRKRFQFSQLLKLKKEKTKNKHYLNKMMIISIVIIIITRVNFNLIILYNEIRGINERSKFILRGKRGKNRCHDLRMCCWGKVKEVTRL